MSRGTLAGCLLAGACGPPPPSSPLVAMEGDFKALAERATRELPCQDEPMAWLCPIKKLPGRRPELPPERLRTLGLQIAIRPSMPLAHLGYESTAVAMLEIDPSEDPATAAFALITSEDGRSSPLQVAAAGAIGRVLRGQDDALRLPAAAEMLVDIEVPDKARVYAFDTSWGADGEEPLRWTAVEGDVPVWVAWRRVGEGGFLGLFPQVAMEFSGSVRPPSSTEGGAGPDGAPERGRTPGGDLPTRPPVPAPEGTQNGAGGP